MTDFLSFLLASPLSQVSFGLMAILLLETIGVIVWSQIQMRRFKPLLSDLSRVRIGTASFAGSADALAVGIDHFLGTEIARTRELLDTLEELAPKIGLILTALAFTIALPSFWSDLSEDPNQFFERIGMATGTTFLGLTISAMAFIQRKWMDFAIDGLLREARHTGLTLKQQEGVQW